MGQKAIHDRIHELDIQDCKVRVTNVDAQSSGQHIVIQVIGEMSTKKQPQRKFTQTFVLAEQTNGYFVLNDIFRYIVGDDDEAEGEELQRVQNDVADGYQEPTSTAVVEPEPHTLTNSHDADEREQQAQLVDQGLEEAADPGDVTTSTTNEPPPTGVVNGDSTPAAEETLPNEDTSAAVNLADGDDVPAVDVAPAEAVAEEPVKQSEKPVAPESTPAASPPKQKPAQPAAPAPIVPKTWATMAAAAANRSNVPPASQAQVQAQAPAPAPGSSTPKPAPIAQPQAIPAAAQESDQPATPQSSSSEWQTAARDHGKKQPRPQSGAAPPENSRAYMKNVSENLTTDMIRDTLTKFGELTYCDINRQKVCDFPSPCEDSLELTMHENCAFADFATPAAYQAAVAANPHEINGERVIVEERRVRPQSFGGNFNQRGGMGPNRGRGNFPKDGGRGNFGPRGRGGPPRGRGGVSQAA